MPGPSPCTARFPSTAIRIGPSPTFAPAPPLTCTFQARLPRRLLFKNEAYRYVLSCARRDSSRSGHRPAAAFDDRQHAHRTRETAGGRHLRARLRRHPAHRRGSLGAALAGFHVSRRPGAARLFALVTAAGATIGYVVCAHGTAVRDRDVEAHLSTGAGRVISVADVTRHDLLAAVQKADPAGSYAMAVRRFPGIPALAVDTSRPSPADSARHRDSHPTAYWCARLMPPVRCPLPLPGRFSTARPSTGWTADQCQCSLRLRCPPFPAWAAPARWPTF